MKKTVKGIGAVLASAVVLAAIPVPQAEAAAPVQWIGSDALSESGTQAPEADSVLPSANQYNYQKKELAAFCHFGPNTFNEIEWGEHYGSRAPGDIFRLEQDFDADTLVRSVKEAGFYKLIVTAKHHDGFCIWDSQYTDYDVAATAYPGDAQTGEKDILAEISAACTKYDVEMGLYLSPWDIHEPSYGYYDANRRPVSPQNDVLDYNEFYNNQLQEILGNDKYGNNGHFVEVWMDGAKGSGANAQEYDFPRWFETIQKNEGKASGKYDSDCMLFGAQAYTTVRWIGNEHGFAGKNTWSKSKVNYEQNTINSRREGEYTLGLADGNQWTVPEADARITSGWFWGTRKAIPKSIEDLGEMYFRSVGHNAPLLLNIPPNNRGEVDAPILARLAEFGENIRTTFRSNMAADEHVSVKASQVRGNDSAYGPAKTIDGDDATYWTTNDGTNTGSLLISLGSSKKVDVISIEEAIARGQRINSYRVEYRNGTGAWQLLEEGETIGAKRLVRVPAVMASEIKITVGTDEGKVPMISEVGVYKASRGFELGTSTPDGMEVIDIEDTDTSDGTGFSFSGRWNKEQGNRFVNETNRWANAGTKLTLKFNGTKAYLVGTKDPNHGVIAVSVDGGETTRVDTGVSPRKTGQILYTSDDLSDGPHTLTLTVDSRAAGIEAAYVINNGGVGMIGLEKDHYTMNEDETIQVKVKRVGGTNGKVTAYLSPNPGSAIQDDFNTEPVEVVLEDGQNEVLVPVQTRRNTNCTGTQNFTVELNGQTEALMVGWIDTATVDILDAESMTKDQLRELAGSVENWSRATHTGDWESFEQSYAAVLALLEEDTPDALAMGRAYTALLHAKEAMRARERYEASDPAVLPEQPSETLSIEAELLELDSSGAVRGKEIRVLNRATSSGGKHVGWFENGNKMKLYYDAPRAGRYRVDLTFASGRDASNENQITFSGEHIDTVSELFHRSGGNDQGTVWQKRSFELNVREGGPGEIVLSTNNGGPNLDKLEITPVSAEGESVEETSTDGSGENEEQSQPEQFTVTAAAVPSEGGTVEADSSSVSRGGSVQLRVIPALGYQATGLSVNGERAEGFYGPNGAFTLENIEDNQAVEVNFEKTGYTQAEPFVFPENEETVPLEAESFTMFNTGGPSEKWKLSVSARNWDGNSIKFINSLNSGDQIRLPYTAHAGVYEITAHYRSGSERNSLRWEGDGKLEAGTAEAGDADPSVTRTAVFRVNVLKSGAGILTFTGPKNGSPQIDRFDVRLVEKAEETAEVPGSEESADTSEESRSEETVGEVSESGSEEAVGEVSESGSEETVEEVSESHGDETVSAEENKEAASENESETTVADSETTVADSETTVDDKEPVRLLERDETVEKGSVYRVRINAKPEQLREVYLDDTLLVQGVDYEVQRGSTILLLSTEVTSKLSDGVHTLRAYFAEGEEYGSGSVSVPFEIRAAASDTTENTVDKENNENKEKENMKDDTDSTDKKIKKESSDKKTPASLDTAQVKQGNKKAPVTGDTLPGLPVVSAVISLAAMLFFVFKKSLLHGGK